jgi:predicted nuclease of predicted toxin-antitoxin system
VTAFLVDECLGMRFAEHLRARGCDALAVGEPGAPGFGSTDPDVLAAAVRMERVLVTCDHDFGDLVIRSGLSHQGVLLLRADAEARTAYAALLDRVIDHQPPLTLPGRFTVATDHRIRQRIP